jgi:hypothetical protein
MNTVRFTALLVASSGAAAMCIATQAWAQQKYTITGASGAPGQYLNEHAIEVGDVPGHRLRVYEIHHDYPHHDLAYAGVAVKELVSRCMSDFINGSGPNNLLQRVYAGGRQQGV